NGSQIMVYKDMGLVSQVFDEASLETLQGHIAIGHTRYATTGGSEWCNAQPTLGPRPDGTVALAHNGNLVNSGELMALVEEPQVASPRTGEIAPGNTTDAARVSALLNTEGSLEEALRELLPRLRGAYCFTLMPEDTLYAVRDPQGIRPLVLGRLERGWVVASETAALDICGASFVREVHPGEMIVIDEQGLHGEQVIEPQPNGCVFEYVYLARPDTRIA